MQKKIIVAGATGLVGTELVKLALGDPEISEVVSLVRKATGNKNPKLHEQVIDFNRLESYSDIVSGDAVFCCLGTTIKKAKSKENFRKVDLEYPLQLAEIAVENNIPQFNIITAMGASADSSIFYNRVKGEVEDGLLKMDIRNINVFRPSLLTGDRQERRTGENIGILLAKFVNPFMVGRLRKYRSIRALDVASAMLIQSKTTTDGFHVLTSDQIYDIAAG